MWPRSKARRLPEVMEVEQEVKARLKRGDPSGTSAPPNCAGRKAGKDPPELAERRGAGPEDLADRLNAGWAAGRNASSPAPAAAVQGGHGRRAEGLLLARLPSQERGWASGFAETRRPGGSMRLKAMEAVIKAERALGNESRATCRRRRWATTSPPRPDPRSGHLRFIEGQGPGSMQHQTLSC